MAKINFDDTIVALSTPPGEGGIAIIRLSGPEALSIVNHVFTPRAGSSIQERKPGRVCYGVISGKNGKKWDEVLATYFKKPRSYTGEDVVEISCHGGARVSRTLVELFTQCGARLAEPGEFTRRAFLNGRIDLVQAEAVLDVIKAKTESALEQAEKQLGGEFSERLSELRADLVKIQAEIESTLDFPEEDKEVYESLDLTNGLKQIKTRLESFLKTSTQGSLLREGLTLAILGKPNVGKSSLLNALVKKERAIVTEIPGTTRDTIEEWVEIQGFPVKLVDTAGISETQDVVESIGIKRTEKAIQEAHLLLVLLDGSRRLDHQDNILIQKLPQHKSKIVCVTKCDLPQKIQLSRDVTHLGVTRPIELSAIKDKGLDVLEKAIVTYLEDGNSPQESVLITNTRHQQILMRCLTAIRNTLSGLEERRSLELIAEDLREAIAGIGEVTGEVYTEELLEVIFNRFCIGK